MKTDGQIQQDVTEELAFDPSIVSEEIGVAVNDGVVTLSGFVPTYAEKYAAEKAAFRVAGVRAVAEGIDVKLHGDTRSDTDIAKAAVDALQWHVWVPDSVKVSVENGNLRLSGSVKWSFQRDSAIAAVRHLAGVRSVLNLIEMQPGPKLHDVKEKIEKALIRTAAEDAKNIRVTFKDGRVLLEGKVHSRAEIIDAKWAALSVPGVNEVDNRLTVT